MKNKIPIIFFAERKKLMLKIFSILPFFVLYGFNFTLDSLESRSTNSQKGEIVYCIEIVDRLTEELEEKIIKDLNEDFASQGVDSNFKRFSVVLKHEDGKVFGVLKAFTVFSEIYIDEIWVDRPFRGKGFGRDLLQMLESSFKDKGFNNINVVTSAFQAPEFYVKSGYSVEFIRINTINPMLNKTFFIKYFEDEIQMQGILDLNQKENH